MKPKLKYLAFLLLLWPVITSHADQANPPLILESRTSLSTGTTSPEIAAEPPESPAEAPTHSEHCSCVVTARMEGLALPKGDAKDLKPNSAPVVGGGVLLSYSTADHVAVIKEIHREGMWVVEGNFNKCKRTKRLVRWDDRHIKGFVAY